MRCTDRHFRSEELAIGRNPLPTGGFPKGKRRMFGPMQLCCVASHCCQLATLEKKIMSKSTITRAVRLALLTAGAAGAGLTGAAAQGQDQLSEITVTGSRIMRQDYEATSPIVTITAETFEQQGVSNAEQLVNTLPQVVPSFSSGNNNPGGGQAWVDLRGVGSVRTLVLVDGKRMTPADATAGSRVDINTIPTGLIERVEIISGGASAVYGSDAVAGAVNFILKKTFDGVEFGGRYGISEQSDAETQAYDVTMGSALAEGRGNIVIYGSFDERLALSKGDREFSAQAVSLTSYFPMGAYFGGANGPSQAAVDNLFQGYGVAPGSVLATDTFAFNQDGSIFASSASDATVVQNYRGDPNHVDVASNFFPGRYSYNFEPWNKLIIPQERVSIGAMGNFTISEKVEAYTRVLFTNYSSQTALAPSPAPTGDNTTNPEAGAFFTIPVTNPFVQANADMLAILNSRTGDSAALPGAGATEDFLYRRRFVENSARTESYERDAYQAMLGLRGDISDKWRFDGYFAHGKLNGQENQGGNVRVSAVEQLLDAPDGGASLCAGGLNPFGQDTLSAECAEFIGVLAKNSDQIEQNLAELVISGDLFSVPAGTVSTAIGAFYQEQNVELLKDSVLASGDVAGFNAEDNVIGSIDHADAFVEFYVPLLKDLPAVQSLAFSAGYRFSDHSIAGGNSSWKGELDWNVNDQLRVRGSVQRAVRAPNVGELFRPQVEDNPQVDDPCNFNSSFRTGANAAQARTLCLAQGVPAAIVDTYTQTTDQIDALLGGNLDLTEETADTYTVGFVWRPAAAERFSLSIDYYDMTIDDVITNIDPVVVANRCFNQDGANPNFELDNFYCNLFGRDSIGQIDDLLEISNNLATLKTSGFDLQADYGFGLGRFGDLNLNLVATFVQTWDLQNLPGDSFLDYKGTIGEDPGETLPEMKGTFSARWSLGDFGATARLRYIDGMEHAVTTNIGSTDPAVCGCTGVPDTWYVDMSGVWQATEELLLRVGVDNLTDQAPRLYTPDADSGTDPSTYDLIGRRYFVSATYRF
jgi:outer membrane receptor protein involved in Fe transport